MKKTIKLIASSVVLLLVGCVNSDDYGTPNFYGDCTSLTVTKSVIDVATTATTAIQQYATDDVIEAFVTSSDEGGNFYKSISFVSVDGNKGFSVPVDAYNLYTKYQVGQKVFVKLKSLYYYKNNQTSSLEIGELLENGEPVADQVGRLSGIIYENVLIKGCDKVNESTLVNVKTIPNTLNDTNIHKIIELENVQFSDANAGKTYFDATNQIGGATNNIVSDNLGNSIIVRVSEFATFAGSVVPTLNGKIRGVLTKYNGDYQLMIRTLNDVMMKNPRFDANPPIGGAAIVYDETLNEPFTSYTTTNQQVFPKYINDAVLGSKYWQVKTFGGNKYIQMSSFGGPAEMNRTLFIVPVNMTAANGFSFKTKDGFFNGNVLKIYYSTNYVPSENITAATLVDITSNFAIASGTTSGYATNFTNSGLYSFSAALTGNGHIIFEYIGNGNGGPTTTMQIDDIVIN
jgi:hypothetical protein